MDINKRIKELEEEIKLLKSIQHNNGMVGVAKDLNNKLIEKATPAELKFMQIAKLKGLSLLFQYRIDIIKKDRIVKFYFADFCDRKNHIIFEIDGKYHDDPEQKKRDLKRKKDLCKLGYKVFNIKNEEVFAGKTTSFLVNAYKSIGINL